MPLYDVELTVSVSGSVQIEASDIDAAREIAAKISAYYVDVSLEGTAGNEFKDLMSPDVEIDGISEAEIPEDEEEI